MDQQRSRLHPAVVIGCSALAALVTLVLAATGARAEVPAANSQAESKSVDLSSLISAGAATWKLTLPQIDERFPDYGFKWLSEERVALRSVSPQLRLQGERVGETVLRTEKLRLHRVDISLYNRGDQGPLSSGEFQTQGTFWKDTVQALVGVAPEKAADAKKSAVGLTRTLWYTEGSAVLLEASSTKGRPEFLRLRLAPKPSGASYLGNSEGNNNKTLTKSELRRFVKRGEGGDTYIAGIPMVDQGPKGYCVVASTERVFRYYGLEIDQHEMAQAAKSTTGGGTDPQQMIGALERVISKLNLRSRTLLEFDAKEFVRLVEGYNREAKKQQAFDRQVSESFGRTIYIDDIYRQFDPSILQAVRTKGTTYKAFQSEVKRQIDLGTPLLWGVRLGLFPEPEIPQAEGGHMRLIVGYNSREDELLYSDSWGAGHELKRMPMEEAFTITTFVHLITPSR